MAGGKRLKLWAPTENRDESACLVSFRRRGSGLNGHRTCLTSPTETVRCLRSESHTVAKLGMEPTFSNSQL